MAALLVAEVRRLFRALRAVLGREIACQLTQIFTVLRHEQKDQYHGCLEVRMTQPATLLFIPGSWHGPWNFEPVQKVLAARGITSKSITLASVGPDSEKLGGLLEDIDILKHAADAIAEDVVIIAHSYGGMVATGTAFGPNVRHIMFLGAFVPEINQTLMSLIPPGPLPPYCTEHDAFSIKVVRERASEIFYNGCPPEDIEEALGKIGLQSVSSLETPVPHCSWLNIPSTYVVLTEDRTVPVPAQRRFSAHSDTVIERDWPHFPMMSHPDDLADLLEKAATGAQI